jgi:hypothetical protein
MEAKWWLKDARPDLLQPNSKEVVAKELESLKWHQLPQFERWPFVGSRLFSVLPARAGETPA